VFSAGPPHTPLEVLGETLPKDGSVADGSGMGAPRGQFLSQSGRLGNRQVAGRIVVRVLCRFEKEEAQDAAFGIVVTAFFDSKQEPNTGPCAHWFSAETFGRLAGPRRRSGYADYLGRASFRRSAPTPSQSACRTSSAPSETIGRARGYLLFLRSGAENVEGENHKKDSPKKKKRGPNARRKKKNKKRSRRSSFGSKELAGGRGTRSSRSGRSADAGPQDQGAYSRTTKRNRRNGASVLFTAADVLKNLFSYRAGFFDSRRRPPAAKTHRLNVSTPSAGRARFVRTHRGTERPRGVDSTHLRRDRPCRFEVLQNMSRERAKTFRTWFIVDRRSFAQLRCRRKWGPAPRAGLTKTCAELVAIAEFSYGPAAFLGAFFVFGSDLAWTSSRRSSGEVFPFDVGPVRPGFFLILMSISWIIPVSASASRKGEVNLKGPLVRLFLLTGSAHAFSGARRFSDSGDAVPGEEISGMAREKIETARARIFSVFRARGPRSIAI